MSAAIVIGERCHYCSHWLSPSDLLHRSGNVAMCLRCLEWHHKALDALATGKPPDGCQECGLTFDQISNSTLDSNIRMRIYMKDGIYQILCERCGDAYERKRIDLYGDTEYGLKNNLKGSK